MLQSVLFIRTILSYMSTEVKIMVEVLFDILEEEGEDDELLLLHYDSLYRKPTDLIFKSRNEEGFYHILIRRHLKSDEEKCRKFCRLNKKQFKFVLSLINEEIKPKTCKQSICPEEKLFLTLRFIATGESYESLSLAYRVSYISRIIKQVLRLLSQKLLPIAMPVPTENYFKRIEKDFWVRWNMPNCISSIDGKHIRVKSPKKSGSLYFNYKDYFSIVLLALVDANYKFVAVDAGSYGKEGDSNIFRKSAIGRKIANNTFNVPPPKYLPGDQNILPHFLIGDEAFPLCTYIMKPYPRGNALLDGEIEIFNYRLCRARRVVENAFGLLSQVFRVFYTPIATAPETCTDLILTACCLHNILRDGYLEHNQQPYYVRDETDNPTQNMIDLASTRGFSWNAIESRDKLKIFPATILLQGTWSSIVAVK